MDVIVRQNYLKKIEKYLGKDMILVLIVQCCFRLFCFLSALKSAVLLTWLAVCFLPSGAKTEYLCKKTGI